MCNNARFPPLLQIMFYGGGNLKSRHRVMLDKPEILYSVSAERGANLRCKGWKQETILRMLENNMYGG